MNVGGIADVSVGGVVTTEEVPGGMVVEAEGESGATVISAAATVERLVAGVGLSSALSFCENGRNTVWIDVQRDFLAPGDAAPDESSVFA